MNEEKKQLAPLALEATLHYIKNHMKDSSHYLGESQYLIEPKLMARIIKHGGDMKAHVPQTETKFFYYLLRWCAAERNIKSEYSNARFECSVEQSANPYQLRVKAFGILHFGRGGGTLLCL